MSGRRAASAVHGFLSGAYLGIRMTYLDDICDPTRVNEADVVRGPNCDFVVNVIYRNQESF